MNLGRKRTAQNIETLITRKNSCFEFINCAWFTWQCFNADGEAAVTEGNGDCYGWLEEIEMPENSELDKIPYLGPQVNETSC